MSQVQVTPASALPLVAGVDEVGRGALFGPVVAAAVIVTPVAARELQQLGVKDSKQLAAPRRQALVATIREQAVDCQLGLATAWEIDRINVLQASLLAMKRAVLQLSPAPNSCWVDGNQPIPELGIPQRTWVKGDQQHVAIAAASILAKVWRDTLIVRLDRHYPEYGLAANKGYGSPQHRLAIERHGVTRHHRRSFRSCR